MNNELKIVRGHGQVSSLVALGFYAVGLVCLVAMLGILLAYPQTLVGDPMRVETLGWGALGVIGFVSSFIFGTHYAVSSLLSGTGLWSRKLAMAHWVLHTLGIGWMVAAFAGMPFLDNPYEALLAGALLFLAGVLVLILNMVATASRLNRWEPAQITVMSSLFWLALTTVFALGLVVDRFHPFMSGEPLELVKIHGYLALAGFFWLGLLGASLKLFSMFTVGARMPGGLSWAGCFIVNGALFVMVPLLLYNPPWAYTALAAVILLGSLAYIADGVRLFAGAKQGLTSGVVGAMLGLASGLVLLGWLVAGAPVVAAEGSIFPGEQARMLGSLALLGTAVMVFLGMGTRVIPFLVWRVRCMPLIGRSKQPEIHSLADKRSPFVCVLCLLFGWIYLIAGQFSGNSAGAQLGALCILVGLFWFFHAILPALQAFFLGVEPPNDTHRSPCETKGILP